MSYGYEIFNFQLSLDEELWAYNVDQYKQSLWWVGIGRWSLYLLCFIFPNPTIPVMPTVIGLAMYSYGCFLLLTSIHEKLTVKDLVFSVIMLVYPTLYHIFSFSTCYGVGAGVLAIGFGSRVLSLNRDKYSLLYASALFSFSIGSYQSLIVLIPMWAALRFMVRVIIKVGPPESPDWNLLVRTAYATILGLIIYVAIWFVLLRLTNSKIEYIDGLWHPEILLNDSLGVLLLTLKNIYSIYISGSNELYSGGVKFTQIMIFSSIAAFLYFLINKRLSVCTSLVSMLLLSLYICAPFVFNLTNGGWVPFRTYMAMPLAFAGISYIGILCSGRLGGVMLTIAMLSILELCIVTVRLENTMQIALRNDMALGDQLVHNINKAIVHSGKNPNYIEFVGYKKFPTNRLMRRVEMIGPSFFEWDGGNNDRITPFLLTLGMPYLMQIDSGHRQGILNEVEGMPIWPAEGSVAVFNDVVIVKFGDYSTQQRARMGM